MEPMTAGQVAALVIGGILAAAGGISTIGGAVEKVVRAVRAAKAPNAAQNHRLDALEEWKKGVDQKLDNDNRRLSAIAEGNRVTQRAILALLDHGIDGNNIDQMQKAKNDLQTHLINR